MREPVDPVPDRTGLDVPFPPNAGEDEEKGIEGFTDWL